MTGSVQNPSSLLSDSGNESDRETHSDESISKECDNVKSRTLPAVESASDDSESEGESSKGEGSDHERKGPKVSTGTKKENNHDMERLTFDIGDEDIDDIMTVKTIHHPVVETQNEKDEVIISLSERTSRVPPSPSLTQLFVEKVFANPGVYLFLVSCQCVFCCPRMRRGQ